MLGISERAVRCFPAGVTQITLLLANVIRGMPRACFGCLSSSLHPGARPDLHPYECPKVSFSCASYSKSVEKQSSARSRCTCPGMCPCATQEVRCEDSCCRFHPSASRHTLNVGLRCSCQKGCDIPGRLDCEARARAMGIQGSCAQRRGGCERP